MKVSRSPVILHRLVGLSLVAVVLALTPAAQASPPNQTWIPGLYDNAVVPFIAGSLAAVEPTVEWSLRRPATVIGLITPADNAGPTGSPLSSCLSRAPPLV